MRNTVKEVKEWISELKKRGIKEFKIKDLPEDIQMRHMIRKANIIGLLEKVSKDKENCIIWRVI